MITETIEYLNDPLLNSPVDEPPPPPPHKFYLRRLHKLTTDEATVFARVS